jgi:dipeptidyl aminopeptidase/acylaminoacyl peptidase
LKALLAALAVCAVLAAPARSAQMPPASAFSAPAAIRMIEISPDGQHLAIVSRDGDQAVIKFATVDQPKVTLSKLGDVAVSRLRWLGNDRVMADVNFPAKIYDRYRTVQRVVVVGSEDGHAVTMLADNKPSNNLVRHSVSGVSPDGHLFMRGFPALPMIKNQPQVLLRVDPSTGKSEQVEEGDLKTFDWGIAKNGSVESRMEGLEKGDFAFQVRSSPGAPWKEFWRTQGPDDVRGYHGYSEPDDAIMITQRGADGDQILLKHLVDGSTTPLGNAHKTDPVAYVWDTKRRTLAGRGFGAERPEMEWLQPDLVGVQASLEKVFKSVAVRLADWSDDRNRFVVEVASPDVATEWYLYDKSHRELSPLGETHPDLKDVQLGATRWITYKARDGLEISAYVTMPPERARTGGSLPLVVLPHDELRSRDYFAFDFMAQFLASRGYVVLRPEYRGSSGFGEAFEKAGDWEWGAKIQTDLLDGVAVLAGQGAVDPKRVCIVGESFAGYLALAGATLFPDAYACAASISGASDLTGVLAGWGGAPFSAVRTVLEKAPRDPRFAAMSPRIHAADARAAILLMWKEQDAVTPSEQSKAMAAALAAAHKPFETVVLTGTDHDEQTGKGFTQMFDALEAFLTKNLPVQKP